MSNDKPTKAIPAQVTPQERAERKAATQRARFNRDRARMLAHVQSCVQQAGAAIAAGDLSLHDQWLDATNTALSSYRQFVALSMPQAPSVDASPAPIAG